ncbi:uncharacterized protein Slp1p [Monosporozyma unispora]|nr:hypothetical protein C6P44_002681 [Kazachstania unispora]
MLISSLVTGFFYTNAFAQDIVPSVISNDIINLTNESVITSVGSINSELHKIANKSIELDSVNEDITNNKSETFLSFDEWKKIKEQDIIKNSKKANDIPRGVVNQMDQSCFGDRECVGEEMEIDLNVFSSSDDKDPEPEGKLYKDKFNYASLGCAATVVKTNSEASGASSILIENKDKYLLNLCSAPNQFVVIELCEDILVEQVVMANFEYFSSNFKTFSVSVSDRFPVPRNGWTNLGEFNGDNSKNLQTFDISNPQIWAKYLRIEISSHYGDEFYCPLSLIRVHGKTMMDEFKTEALEEQRESSLEEQIINENKDAIRETDESIEETKTDVTPETSVLSTPEKKKVEPKYVMESDLLDESNNWPYFDTENKTLVPQLPDPMEWSFSGLEPLRFEEFLKELSPDLFNCDPREREIFSSNITSPIDLGNNSINGTDSANTTASVNGTEINRRPIPISSQSSPEDSIFKSIIRRLNFLENNSTMTILYVEEQSKLLSKSFSKLEDIYLNRFDDLVNTFNVTVMNNIDVLKLFAQQLKEQSLTILEEQKRTNEEFNNKNQLRMQRLEEDVRFQKRLLFLCLFALAFFVYHETLKHLLTKTEQNYPPTHPIKITKRKSSSSNRNKSNI